MNQARSSSKKPFAVASIFWNNKNMRNQNTNLKNYFLSLKSKYSAKKSRAKFSKFSERARQYNDNGKFQFARFCEFASFKHSGHTGDVIYSLPTMKALAAKTALYLNAGAKSTMPPGFNHPYGDDQLPEKVIEMLRPLLLSQDYINKVEKFTHDKAVDFDLDIFRDTPQNLRAGSISQWYFPVFGISCDLSVPWITLEKTRMAEEYIIISRSSRYNNESLDYSFLSRYPKLGFVGIESEYNQIKRSIAKIEYFRVENFLELALIINSSGLFIGNQSFPYSIAESMKVPRLLEQCLYAPNVIPMGGYSHPIVFQKQFEFVVNSFMN